MVYIKYGGSNFKPPPQQHYFRPPQQQQQQQQQQHQRSLRPHRPQSSFLKRMETQNPYFMQAITAKKPLTPPTPQNATQPTTPGAPSRSVSSNSNYRRPDAPLLPRLTHFEQCETNILSKLLELRAFRVLHNSIRPNTSRCEFEILEFYGDAVLYERVSAFLMSSRRFMSPHLLTTIRTEVVRNTNLARVYDTLQLKILIDEHEELTEEKEKADVVESIIGELSEASKNNSELSMQITTTLKNLLAFICFTGESQYFASLGVPKTTSDPSKLRKKKYFRNKTWAPPTTTAVPAPAPAPQAPTATTFTTTTAAPPAVTFQQFTTTTTTFEEPAVQQEQIQSIPVASVEEVVEQAQVEPKYSPKSPISPPRSPMVFLAKTPSPPARTLTPDSISYDDVAPLIEDIAQQKPDDLCLTPADQVTDTITPVIVEVAYNDLIEEVDQPGLQTILDFLTDDPWWETNNSPPLQHRSRPTSPTTNGLPTITQLKTTQPDSNSKLPSPVMTPRYYKIAGKFYPVEFVSSLLMKEAENH